jgi:two-component system, sensor histidine kinase and response regulator
LVEDDEELTRIFVTLLKRKGLDVVSYLNSLQALENFRINIDKYSLVLTDYKMEGINGVELAIEIRPLKGNKIVIIMITAFSLEDIENKKEIPTLIDKVITKPFSLNNLDAILSSYLANQSFP